MLPLFLTECFLVLLISHSSPTFIFLSSPSTVKITSLLVWSTKCILGLDSREYPLSICLATSAPAGSLAISIEINLPSPYLTLSISLIISTLSSISL